MCYACIYQRMTETELKNKLLETGIFIDNEWLDKYVELVVSNQGTSYTRFKTQNHHIIPVCYYRNRSIEVDNSINNLVTLLLKDHLLAHCYLVLSSDNKQFKANMFYAICFISGLEVDDTKVIELVDSDLSVYQEAYEQGRISAYSNNPMFDEVKKAHHDRVMRSTEVSSQISQTMKNKIASGDLFDEEHCRNLSKSAKLRCYAYKDVSVKRILKSDAEKYFNDGWRVPYYDNTYAISKSTIAPNIIEQKTERKSSRDRSERVCWIHNESTCKIVPLSKLEEFISLGWIKGSGVHQDSESRKRIYTEEVRKKLSVSNKGHSPANKGIPCSEEQKKKLSEHFKGTRWMNNGIIQKQVQQLEIKDYIDKGFTFGILKRPRKEGDEDCENS